MLPPRGENKHCKYCDQTLPVEMFDMRRASKDGLSFKCKPCAREYNRQRYVEISDRFKARATAWAAANPERRREIRLASAERHREEKRLKARAYARRVRCENPEYARAVGRYHAKLRRERLLGVEGVASQGEIAALLDRAGGLCVYCAQPASLTLDHFEPVASGGSGSIENLIPCCKPCNSSKNKRDGAEWVHKRAGVVGLARAVMFLEGQTDWAVRLEA